MSQTPAILIQMAEDFNLGGKNATEKAACLQGLLDMNDVFGESKGFPDKPDRNEFAFEAF